MRSQTKSKVTNFTDLATWRESHKLVIMIFAVADKLPAQDNFGLKSQMQRAAISVTSNIAEGFGRRSLKENIQFYSVAKGSLVELQNQLLIAKDTKRINNNLYMQLADQATTCLKLLHGLIRVVHAKQTNN